MIFDDDINNLQEATKKQIDGMVKLYTYLNQDYLKIEDIESHTQNLLKDRSIIEQKIKQIFLINPQSPKIAPLIEVFNNYLSNLGFDEKAFLKQFHQSDE